MSLLQLLKLEEDQMQFQWKMFDRGINSNFYKVSNFQIKALVVHASFSGINNHMKSLRIPFFDSSNWWLDIQL